jgi:hypothetical protein
MPWGPLYFACAASQLLRINLQALLRRHDS